MSTGGTQRVMSRFRVPLLALVVPLVLAVGLLWLGPSAARATQLLVHQPLTLHGGPGTAFSVLATLASGTKVEVLWCNAQASWCLVENGEVEGWAPRAELITHDASSAQSPDDKAPASGTAAAGSLVTNTGGPAGSIVESSISTGGAPSAAAVVSSTTSPHPAGRAGTSGLHLSLSFSR
jgi:hypothetical protein